MSWGQKKPRRPRGRRPPVKSSIIRTEGDSRSENALVVKTTVKNIIFEKKGMRSHSVATVGCGNDSLMEEILENRFIFSRYT